MTYKQEQIIKEVSSCEEVYKATVTFKDGAVFMIDRTASKGAAEEKGSV